MPEIASSHPAPRAVQLYPLTVGHAIRPEDASGRTVGGFVDGLLAESGIEPKDRDVLVVSSKIASFFEPGCMVRLGDVAPSRKARVLGRLFG